MQPHKTDALFTRREREVVECVIEGYSLREAAIRLCVVYQCITNHIQAIYDKAGIFDRRTLNALTAWWFRTNFNLCDVGKQIGSAGLLILSCIYTFTDIDRDQMIRRTRRVRRSEYELIN